jgi:nitrate reductase beta subunit
MYIFYNKGTVYDTNKRMFDNIADLMIMEDGALANRESKRAHKIHNIIVRYVDKYIKEFENPFLFDYEMNEKEFLSIVNTQTEYREIWGMDKDPRQIFLEKVTNFCY